MSVFSRHTAVLAWFVPVLLICWFSDAGAPLAEAGWRRARPARGRHVRRVAICCCPQCVPLPCMADATPTYDSAGNDSQPATDRSSTGRPPRAAAPDDVPPDDVPPDDVPVEDMPPADATPGRAPRIEASPSDVQPETSDSAAESPEQNQTWRSLFDGQTLTGWKVTQFGGQSDVIAENGELTLGMGSSLTGITYDGQEPLPRSNYEIALEAKRVEGIDFFCGLTFPVKDAHCSFIVGGWAGGVVGLSSIDGKDASENETTRYMSFDRNRWYRIRVRVTDDVIQAWIDDEQVVYQRITDRKISTRPEVDLSAPLGICTWETKAALRNIRLRTLQASELAVGE